MKKFALGIVFTVCVISPYLLLAQESASRSSDADWLRNVWSIEVGFGEIPFLSGSFKPSISFGRYFNQYIYVGWMVQLHDILERGPESYNARNTGLGDIQSTREVTGVRSLIGVRVRPHRYAPYASAGLLFNGSDREEMVFGDISRPIGEGVYEGAVTVVQTRAYALRPAMGIGYGIQCENGFTFSVEMTGAFFLRAPSPEIQIIHAAELSEADEQAITKKLQKEFKGNFHNRYHLFHIGAGYAW